MTSEAPLLDVPRRAGITVNSDRIVFHLEGEVETTLKLATLISKANDDPGLLMQWAVFWQLVTLNQKITEADKRATESVQAHDPSKMVEDLMKKYMPSLIAPDKQEK